MVNTRWAWSILLGVVCFVSAANAQPVSVEATVIDAVTEETIPGATVQVEGTDLGSAANSQGRARIDGVELPASIVARHLGYQTLRVNISEQPADGILRIVFELEPTSLISEEVLIIAQRTGELVMRQVLARKETLTENLQYSTMEAYTQFRLERKGSYELEPTLIRFTEALSNVYWMNGRDSREVVIARHRIPSGEPFRYVDIDPVPDIFLNNFVELDGRLVPTPTHPDALSLYVFHSGEITIEDDRRFIDIAVVPRRRGLFAGRIRVVDSLFVLAEAELRIPDHGRATGFIQDWDAEYHITYSPARDSLWLPERFERRGRVQAGTTGSSIPEVLFHQLTFIDRWMPGSRGSPDLWEWDDRYYSPSGVYEGRDAYRRVEGYHPVLDEEQEILKDLRQRDLARMLFRTGLLSAYVRIPIYGSDDRSR